MIYDFLILYEVKNRELEEYIFDYNHIKYDYSKIF